MYDVLTIPQLLAITGLLLILLELIIGIQMGFDLVLIGTILIISSTLTLLGLTDNLILITSALLSLLYITLGRTYVRNKFTSSSHLTNTDRLMNQTAITLTEITPHHPGQVRIDDETWRAKSTQAIPSGSRVTVTAIDGVTLIIKPSNSK